jgi:hypothetical protein
MIFKPLIGIDPDVIIIIMTHTWFSSKICFVGFELLVSVGGHVLKSMGPA